MEIKVIDNLMNETYQEMLCCYLQSNSFPWYYSENTSILSNVGKRSLLSDTVNDVPQFTHIFYLDGEPKSSNFNMITPIIDKLEEFTGKKYYDKIIRIKANLIYQHPNYNENFHNLPHNDAMPYDKLDTVESLLYYVNDSDGDTFIFNEKIDGCDTSYGKIFDNNLTIKGKIGPKKGRLVLFDSSHLHASSPPKEHKTRIILNFVFYNKNDNKG